LEFFRGWTISDGAPGGTSLIPKPAQKWFRDALIARNSGKILAAEFYLRTFIEQFARRQTGHLADKLTGHVIMTEYADTLPAEQRDYMPSLREWCDKLSAKLHTADEDVKLFENAREEIERHFDIRRVYKMDDRKPTEKKQPLPLQYSCGTPLSRWLAAKAAPHRFNLC
jgi:hypothetical protein